MDQETKYFIRRLKNIIAWGEEREKDNTIYELTPYDLNEDWIDKIQELVEELE